MDTEMGTAPAVAQEHEDIKKLREAMLACQSDRQALAEEIAPLFKQLWGEALKCLETALPDYREPGSLDAKLHAALRSRILNEGNSKIRELPVILNNYLLNQVFTREVVTKVKMPTEGVFNLPVGISMPPRSH